MKISIENMQSLKSAELEVDGFCVVVGRSNLGKSAVIRAVEGAIYNHPVQAYVRSGAPFLRVTLEGPDYSVQWKKGPHHNDYVINGVTYESVGRDAPPKIKELGFKDVELNKSKLRVQISDQFHPLFLISESGSDIAQAIADVSRIYEIQAAQDAADKDKRANQATLKVREQDSVYHTQRLKELESFSDKIKILEDCVEESKVIENQQKYLKVTASILAQKTYAQAKIENLCNLPEVPSGDVLDTTKIHLMTGYVKSYHALVKVRDIDVIIPSALDLDTLRDQAIRSRGYIKTYHDVRRRLESLTSLETLDIPPIDALTSLDLRGMAQHLQHMKNLVTMLRSIQSEVEDSAKDLKNIESEIQQAHDRLGVCPTCGQMIPHSTHGRRL
jgi:hypothetical protein